ncbi:MAG: pantoate--beta-alanine ligase [Longimicrobiales bacterium]
MIVATDRAALAQGLSRLREGGRRVALVPTMGFLHEGHLSLVDEGASAADRTVVSIFVNPLQFGPSEDLDSYPRDRVRDLELLRARGADLVFAPEVADMYPDGPPLVTVSPGPMERRLCGAFRPGHFRGVLTVVARLFGLILPDVAVFGRKDYQQAVLIRRMVRDLELRVDVRIGPVVREDDGLAMSSRNAYLSADERADAVGIHQALRRAAELHAAGERRAGALVAAVTDSIARRRLLEVQYVEAVHPDTLEAVSEAEPGTVLAVAAFCGTTRLIDNVDLG